MDVEVLIQGRESEPMQLTEAQDCLVQVVVRDAPSEWSRIVVDVEIEETTDDYAMDIVSFAIAVAQGKISDTEVELSIAARRAVVDVFVAARSALKPANIGGFQLTVEESGRYRIDWSYDAPKRLHGVWDAEKEARLDNYLDLHRHEFGGSR